MCTYRLTLSLINTGIVAPVHLCHRHTITIWRKKETKNTQIKTYEYIVFAIVVACSVDYYYDYTSFLDYIVTFLSLSGLEGFSFPLLLSFLSFPNSHWALRSHFLPVFFFDIVALCLCMCFTGSVSTKRIFFPSLWLAVGLFIYLFLEFFLYLCAIIYQSVFFCLVPCL